MAFDLCSNRRDGCKLFRADSVQQAPETPHRPGADLRIFVRVFIHGNSCSIEWTPAGVRGRIDRAMAHVCDDLHCACLRILGLSESEHDVVANPDASRDAACKAKYDPSGASRPILTR